MLIVLAAAMLAISSAGIAGTTVKEVIELETDGYESRKKGTISFSHSKHQDAYRKQFPDMYTAGCGECHHDENNKPLVDLKVGDEVQACISCHKKPAHATGKSAKGLSKKQKLEYHANALHKNCKDCHREVNKATGAKKAPVTCKACHGES